MKKSLVLGILGLAVGAVTGYGQGYIFLDNYLSSTYNPGCLSAELGGGLAPVGFTVGLYYDPIANANITSSVLADPTGIAIPTSLNAALVAATGPGSTAPILSFCPGYFSAGTSFLIQPDAATPAQSSYTIMLVAYNGSSYATSTIRLHSVAVYIQDAAPSVAYGGDVGTFFPAGVPMIPGALPIPEPGTLALAGLGGLSLLLFRRRK
jgi:hypothetical protein